MMPRLFAVGVYLFAESAVFAHEGHGDPEHTDGMIHYVVNPSHAIPVMLSVLVVATAIFAMRKISAKQSDRNK